jgi:hypothetical protein
VAVLAVVLAAGALLVSGGSFAGPPTPAGLPALPPPFLGVAVVGGGELTAAIDAYGAVVDLRPVPAGPGLIENPVTRQTAGTVPADTGIVPRLRLGGGRALPFWRADAIAQRYLPGTNVVVTTARFGRLQAAVTYAGGRETLACVTEVSGPAGGAAQARPAKAAAPPTQPRDAGRAPRVELSAESAAAAARLRCDTAQARAAVERAKRADRGWRRASAPLGAAAPTWAEQLHGRSLLVLRALADRHSGAVAAGARDGWAYVWPRDAGTAALAFAAAGHRGEARRVARFLSRLDLSAAARFHGDGAPVPGREAQGDAAGWVAVAARAAGLAPDDAGAGDPSRARAAAGHAPGWRDRPDYQEKAPGDFLGNAIAATASGDPAHASGAAIASRFGERGALVRVADDSDSGTDSAAAWAVRPFPLPGLSTPARASLRRLLASGGRFGIVPSADWPEADPWTAPTAWSAWAFAALARDDRDPSLARADRRAALALLAALRRAATPTGALPERVDAQTGAPRSTTPLVWSHAFAILALRELWP